MHHRKQHGKQLEIGKRRGHRETGPFSSWPSGEVMARAAERLPAASVQLVKMPGGHAEGLVAAGPGAVWVLRPR